MWYENYFNPKTFEKPASQKYDRTKADPNIVAAINCLCRSFLWVRPFTHGAGAVLTQLPVVTMEPNTIFTPPPGQPTTPTFVNLVSQSYLWLCEKLPVTGCSYIHVHIDLNFIPVNFSVVDIICRLMTMFFCLCGRKRSFSPNIQSAQNAPQQRGIFKLLKQFIGEKTFSWSSPVCQYYYTICLDAKVKWSKTKHLKTYSLT